MVKLNRDTRNSDNSFCRDIDISFLLARIHFGQREWAFVNLHVVRSAQTLRPFFLESSRSHLRPGRVTYILFLPSLQRQALNLLPEAQDRTRATVVRVVGHQLPHGLSGACRVLAARFCPAPRRLAADCFLLLRNIGPLELTVGIGFHFSAYLSLEQDCI